MNRVTCVYRIRNIQNGKSYVGSSTDAKSRMLTHFRLLKLQKHTSQHLQNAYNQYGRECFVFEILQNCQGFSAESLVVMEAEWIGLLNVCDREFGYNTWLFPQTITTHKHTSEAKKKIGLASLGRKPSDEAIRLLVERNKSDAMRTKISQSKTGRCLTPEHRAALSLAKTGTKLTQETRIKLSNTKKGVRPSQEIIEKRRAGLLKSKKIDAQTHNWTVTSPEGCVYHIRNLTKFCKQQNLRDGCMSLVASGKRQHHKGWTCVRDTGTESTTV